MRKLLLIIFLLTVILAAAGCGCEPPPPERGHIKCCLAGTTNGCGLAYETETVGVVWITSKGASGSTPSGNRFEVYGQCLYVRQP